MDEDMAITRVSVTFEVDGIEGGGRYRFISERALEPIEEGELLPGEQLPNLDRLSADYGISRATAQKAVRVLIGEGLAVSRPRWGVFVKQR